MLKYIRIALVTLFAASLAAAIALFYYESTRTDLVGPVFTSDVEMLEISVSDPKEILLSGLSAYDDVDGDLTDKIRIKSISPLINDTDVYVEYIVFDNVSNYAVYTRLVRYTDYIPPRFSLRYPLIYRVGETIRFRDSVRLTDMRDGDISGRIQVEQTNVVNTIPGVYSALLSATNDIGDTVYLPLTVQITDNSVSRPKISLKKYLVYLNQGERVQFYSFLESVTDPLAEPNTVISLAAVTVNSSGVDMNTPGVYEVYYFYTGISGETGNTILTVIVQ